MPVSPRPMPAARAGFTLIELLVVLGIIGALVAITLGIGSAMVESGKARQTADTIKTLDLIAAEHRAASDGGIPWYVSVPTSNGTTFIPLVDGVYRADSFNNGVQVKSLIPALSWYLKSITEYTPVASAESLLNQIDGKLRQVEMGATGNPPIQLLDAIPGKRLAVLDAWGRPIRMVVPKLDGVIPTRSGGVIANDGGPMQNPRDYAITPPNGTMAASNVRRNYLSNADRKARADAGQPYMAGDSDGGRCQGDVPYFYSAGKDGDPSTRADNVYSIRPKFADPD